MNAQTKSRTLGAMLAIVALIMVNNLLSGILKLYAEWYAWTITGVAVVVIVTALRFQGRLSTGVLLALLALPFVLAALGAILGM